MDFRIGLGQDSHKINVKCQKSDFKNLILAGVVIGENLTISADSDGDVIAHALCNALSSACGNRSISFYADPLCKKGVINSFEYIREILKREIWAEGFKVNNVSIAVEAGRPKLEKFHDQMKANLANVLNIDSDRVGITFTSGEKLTPFGKGGGIQVFCTVSLIKE